MLYFVIPAKAEIQVLQAFKMDPRLRGGDGFLKNLPI